MMNVADIQIERNRQDLKWGIQNHTLIVWLAILAEEFGEASKAINEFHFRDIRSIVDVKKELVQTAAVAIAILECIERTHITELR
jgi:hypothetical protein